MPPSSAAPIEWPCYAVVSYRPSLLTWALLTASLRVKATWEAQRKMAYGDVSPEMFAKFAAEFAGNFAPSVKVSVNPKSKVRHTALKWTRAQCTPSRSAKIRHFIKFFSISMSILTFILILSRIIFRCLHHHTFLHGATLSSHLCATTRKQSPGPTFTGSFADSMGILGSVEIRTQCTPVTNLHALEEDTDGSL